MAYTGLAHVVGAKYSETENGIQYSNGFRYGSAVRIRIDPKYEDVSEYGDINSEDEEEMFAYASVTLETSEITQTAEKEVSDSKYQRLVLHRMKQICLNTLVWESE